MGMNSSAVAEDCMYFLQQGHADVVIMGTVDASSKHGECCKLVCRWGGAAVQLQRIARTSCSRDTQMWS
jgi:hypothetical protein